VFETLRRLEAGLEPVGRERLGVLLVSLDPKRDSAAELGRLEAALGVDTSRWLVGTAALADRRAIAGRLGIAFDDVGGGAVHHDPVVVLLDARGVELARTRQIGAIDGEFLRAVRAATASRGGV
jgi:protein SCO1/2